MTASIKITWQIVLGAFLAGGGSAGCVITALYFNPRVGLGSLTFFIVGAYLLLRRN